MLLVGAVLVLVAPLGPQRREHRPLRLLDLAGAREHERLEPQPADVGVDPRDGPVLRGVGGLRRPAAGLPPAPANFR